MQLKLADSWLNILQNQLVKPYFIELMRFVNAEYNKYICFPKQEVIFAAFDYCAFNAVKVVIIGQDPYHGNNQANGLCFSVNDGVAHPPSLVNIFKELTADVGKAYPQSGNLKSWATQGVLLVNATLTVREGQAGSHQKKGWETFTDSLIEKISEEKEGVVFLLWGGFAKKKIKLIDGTKHFILTSGHPSPLSANRGYWFGNQHFSKTNTFLQSQNKAKIIW